MSNHTKLMQALESELVREYGYNSFHAGFNSGIETAIHIVQQHEAGQTAQELYSDDTAVDRFAAVMKAKLAEKREQGRGGWDDEAKCEIASLAQMLVEHVRKGDPVDIANFCMMLHQREQMAVEHHPCHGGSARNAIQKAAQQPAQAEAGKAES